MIAFISLLQTQRARIRAQLLGDGQARPIIYVCDEPRDYVRTLEAPRDSRVKKAVTAEVTPELEGLDDAADSSQTGISLMTEIAPTRTAWQNHLHQSRPSVSPSSVASCTSYARSGVTRPIHQWYSRCIWQVFKSMDRKRESKRT